MSFYLQKLVVKIPFRIFYRVFQSNFGQSLLKIQKLDPVIKDSISSKFTHEKEIFCKKINKSRLIILLRDYYDTFHYQKIQKSNLHNFIKFENLNILNQSLCKGRPIILYSAHFGRMIFPLVALSKLGYNVNLVSADSNSFPKNEKKFQQFKQITIEKSLSGKIITNNRVRKLYKSLSGDKNQILAMIIDNFQFNYDNNCVRLEFLNKFVLCNRSVVKLAKKTNAILIPYFAIESNEVISCKFGNPIDEFNNCQDELITKVYMPLETEINAYPFQWWNWHLLNCIK